MSSLLTKSSPLSSINIITITATTIITIIAIIITLNNIIISTKNRYLLFSLVQEPVPLNEFPLTSFLG